MFFATKVPSSASVSDENIHTLSEANKSRLSLVSMLLPELMICAALTVILPLSFKVELETVTRPSWPALLAVITKFLFLRVTESTLTSDILGSCEIRLSKFCAVSLSIGAFSREELPIAVKVILFTASSAFNE